MKTKKLIQPLVTKMTGPLEKKMERIKLESPRDDVYEGVDLSVLPKYICFRAALMREKLLLQYAVMALFLGFMAYFGISRAEMSGLYDQLRRKEYILAPGVMDFTPASPQTVSDSYVNHAAIDFLGQLGNINPANIEENYTTLSQSMSRELGVQFLAESSPWIEKVKTEQLSEMMTVTDRQIESDGKGSYRLTAFTRCDSYLKNEHLGYRNEVIEMIMRLVPPKSGRRWYLEITNLKRTGMDAYKTTSNLDAGGSHE